MPYTLSAQFNEERSVPVLANTYKDGSFQITALADISRKRFRLGKRLTVAQLSTLRTFWNQNKSTPFWFYPKQSDHDPAGLNTTGRYLVVLSGAWNESWELGRMNAQMELLEVS